MKLLLEIAQLILLIGVGLLMVAISALLWAMSKDLKREDLSAEDVKHILSPEVEP